MTRERARISVEWGYEIQTITLTARNWARVKRASPFAFGARAIGTTASSFGITGTPLADTRAVSLSITTCVVNGMAMVGRHTEGC